MSNVSQRIKNMQISSKIKMHRSRMLTSKGLEIKEAIEYTLGSLFTLIVILYAAIRAHKVYTQMPATFSTTSLPNALPIDLVNQFFPNQLPPSTFEFPAFTVCVPPHSNISVSTCGARQYPVDAITACDTKGIYQRTILIQGQTVPCITVHDLPGAQLVANTNQDSFVLVLQVIAPPNITTEAMVIAHHHSGPKVTPKPDFDSFFDVGVSSMVEILGRKVVEIDINEVLHYDYDLKSSTVVEPNQPNTRIAIEFWYPQLEITYSKTFLPFDKNNWLGEVGGFACLMFFLLRLVMALTVAIFKRTDALSMTGTREYVENVEESQGFARLGN
ncbi:hypothetical protein HDV01_005562 [Terramyces sp. JEL0728]|nr:hypothetical protein HDV01_005562 [Terramyces sp. JEL0728]